MRYTARTLLIGAIALLDAALGWAADGDILERTPIAAGADAAFVAERVVYESDGLRIVGFLAYPAGAPAGTARLPCVLFNRGGNRDFGATTPATFSAGHGASRAGAMCSSRRTIAARLDRTARTSSAAAT